MEDFASGKEFLPQYLLHVNLEVPINIHDGLQRHSPLIIIDCMEEGWYAKLNIGISTRYSIPKEIYL